MKNNLKEEHEELIKALNLDKEGGWEEAHNLVQKMSTPGAAWVHAYLHRKEGDSWNADYWYKRAGKDFFRGSLEEEWQFLMNSLNSK